MEVNFYIDNEKFYNNGKVILKSLPDIEKNFRDTLSQKGEVTVIKRKSKNKSQYDGITADSLNRELRKLLGQIRIKGETHVENGVFYHRTKEGFDFSIYDEEYNLSRLYNYYLGAVGILDGAEKIFRIYDKMGYDKKEWKGKVETIQSKVAYNSDYIVDKEYLTIVGELQFGNWALIYRDLFRLLAADSNPGVDFYIYITAADGLSRLLSDKTVSYRQAESVIGEYLSIIKTPMWLIGLGIEGL